jgi:hypothetical protein
LDLHNTSIDESAAALGHCGMTDLHNGRVCQSPVQHHGGCEFTDAPVPAIRRQDRVEPELRGPAGLNPVAGSPRRS